MTIATKVPASVFEKANDVPVRPLPKCFEKPPGSILPVRAEAKVRRSALLTSDTVMLCYVSKKQQTSVGT